jgi:hypothetical protein
VTFELRLVVVVGAAFAVAALAGAALVPLVHRRALRLAAGAPADALLRARLLPLALALVASGLVLGSWLLFERRGVEAIGLVLPALALAGLLLIGSSVARFARLVLVTTRTVNDWLRTADELAVPALTTPAFVVDVPFPVVAVVGIWRPRLVVARSVVEACTPEEFGAVVAHERHHVERRDNLRRALVAAVPDPFAWLPASRQLLADWREATEDAADDAVDRLGAEGRPLLAQALLRVARLMPAGGWEGPWPVSTLYRAEGLDRRVRRLLATAPPVPGGGSPWAAAVVLVAGVSGLAALDRVHELVELAVTHLP